MRRIWFNSPAPRLTPTGKAAVPITYACSEPCHYGVMMEVKIVSGGQTGADSGALEAALRLNRTCGGWCPSDCSNESGLIPAHFPLTALASGGYRERTIRNVTDSDGTLIFYFAELEGGTEQTVLHCIRQRKPYKLIDGSEIPTSRAAELAHRFVLDRSIEVLNVAGPRASKCPSVYVYAFEVVTLLLQRL